MNDVATYTRTQQWFANMLHLRQTWSGGIDTRDTMYVTRLMILRREWKSRTRFMCSCIMMYYDITVNPYRVCVCNTVCCSARGVTSLVTLCLVMRLYTPMSGRFHALTCALWCCYALCIRHIACVPTTIGRVGIRHRAVRDTWGIQCCNAPCPATYVLSHTLSWNTYHHVA